MIDMVDILPYLMFKNVGDELKVAYNNLQWIFFNPLESIPSVILV